MNSTHLKITAIVLAAFCIIIADLALLGIFDNSKNYATVNIYTPYYIIEIEHGNYFKADEVPFVIDYDNSTGKWTFRDADEWNVVRKYYFGGYTLSEDMPYTYDTENSTLKELKYTYNYSADGGVLRYFLYYHNAMNVECIEALSNITYTLSRQTVTDNLTREELKDIPEELIYCKDKSTRFSNLTPYESICMEDTYNLPIPKINEIYYLRVVYKGIDSVYVPGRTIPKPNYHYDTQTSVFVIKDNRTRFDSPYNEFTATILDTQKKMYTTTPIIKK